MKLITITLVSCVTHSALVSDFVPNSTYCPKYCHKGASLRCTMVLQTSVLDNRKLDRISTCATDFVLLRPLYCDSFTYCLLLTISYCGTLVYKYSSCNTINPSRDYTPERVPSLVVSLALMKPHPGASSVDPLSPSGSYIRPGSPGIRGQFGLNNELGNRKSLSPCSRI